MIHLPPDLTWDAFAVKQCIESRGHSASVKINDVVVFVSKHDGDSFLTRLSRWMRGPLTVSVAVNPRRFIRNIELEYDVLRMPIEHRCLYDIRRGLQDFGCITDDDRRIANRYLPDSKQVSELFDEIEVIQREKESLVASQDLDGAADKRDAEELLRVQVDDILRAHLDSDRGG